jgi:hypothetical protein
MKIAQRCRLTSECPLEHKKVKRESSMALCHLVISQTSAAQPHFAHSWKIGDVTKNCLLMENTEVYISMMDGWTDSGQMDGHMNGWEEHRMSECRNECDKLDITNVNCRILEVRTPVVSGQFF